MFTRCFVVGILLTLQVFSAAGTIIGNATDNGDGTWTYSYTVDNDRSFDISAWTLEMNLTPDQVDWNMKDEVSGGDVKVPTGDPLDPFDDWSASEGTPVFDESAQDFQAFFAPADVKVGETLSGFQFTSGFSPDSANFTIEFGAGGSTATGTTIGPGTGKTAVPDAGNSFWLTGCSLALIVLFSRFLPLLSQN